MYIMLRQKAGFNFQLEFPGKLEKVEYINGEFVFVGDSAGPDTYVWVAPTGDNLPENITEHLGTFVWYEGGARRVAHVFQMADQDPHWYGNTAVWHEVITQSPFEPDGSVVKFLHLEPNQMGDFHIWYITDKNTSNSAKYTIGMAGKVQKPALLEVGRWVITLASVPATQTNATAVTQYTATSTTPAQAVDNGLVFNYQKKDGSTRLVRLSHVQFHNSKGVQKVTGYDYDRKDLRTFILANIIDFPAVV